MTGNNDKNTIFKHNFITYDAYFLPCFFAASLSFRVDRVVETDTGVYYSSSIRARGHITSSFQQVTYY